MVIHGGLDGYSRLITFLGASDNNRAKTVASLFKGGVEAWGWLSRVRADHGREKVQVAELMEGHRGRYQYPDSNFFLRLTADPIFVDIYRFRPRVFHCWDVNS